MWGSLHREALFGSGHSYLDPPKGIPEFLSPHFHPSRRTPNSPRRAITPIHQALTNSIDSFLDSQRLLLC
jgi:hypothetical protein